AHPPPVRRPPGRAAPLLSVPPRGRVPLLGPPRRIHGPVAGHTPGRDRRGRGSARGAGPLSLDKAALRNRRVPPARDVPDRGRAAARSPGGGSGWAGGATVADVRGGQGRGAHGAGEQCTSAVRTVVNHRRREVGPAAAAACSEGSGTPQRL